MGWGGRGTMNCEKQLENHLIIETTKTHYSFQVSLCELPSDIERREGHPPTPCRTSASGGAKIRLKIERERDLSPLLSSPLNEREEEEGSTPHSLHPITHPFSTTEYSVLYEICTTNHNPIYHQHPHHTKFFLSLLNLLFLLDWPTLN